MIGSITRFSVLCVVGLVLHTSLAAVTDYHYDDEGADWTGTCATVRFKTFLYFVGFEPKSN